MGMYWLDLLAWQQITDVAVGPRGSPGAVQLCTQDPARTYLSISIVQQTNTYVFLTTNPNPNVNTAGIPLMSQWPTFGAPSMGQPPDWGVDMRDVKWTASPDGSGGFNGAYPAGTIAPILSVGRLLVYTPARVEFFVEKHGALAQSAWYTYDGGGLGIYHVLSVRQDSSPCDTAPLSRSKKRAVPQDVSWMNPSNYPEASNVNVPDRPAAGKQSLLMPDWNDIGKDTRPE